MSYQKDYLRLGQLGAIALTFAMSTAICVAKDKTGYRYEYLSLYQFVPEGYGCFVAGDKITRRGAVYGTTYAPPPEYCD